MMSCIATLGLRVLIDLRKGSKCSVGCGLAVFLLGVIYVSNGCLAFVSSPVSVPREVRLARLHFHGV